MAGSLRLIAPARLASLPSWLLSLVATRSQQLVLDAVGDAERRAAYAVLTALDEFGVLSQVELSRRTGIDTADMVGLLGAMEGRGLIARTRDVEDRRRNAVALTRSGRSELRRLEAALRDAQERLLEPLDATQRKSFVDCLERLLDHHSNLRAGDS